jgi:hypothetical protein
MDYNEDYIKFSHFQAEYFRPITNISSVRRSSRTRHFYINRSVCILLYSILLEMTIFDINGNQVFQTTSRIKGWDGKLPNGTYAAAGESYHWKVIIENDLSKEQKYFNGTLNVSP